MEYHVSKNGNDKNPGTKTEPFLTISRAAAAADEGDMVIVHEGVYRECVKPKNGARTAAGRITYTAADGEKAVIKGSEIIQSWNNDGEIWKTVIPNEFFGGYNPYADIIDGDWLMTPLNPALHTGQVYSDGTSLKEVLAKSDVSAMTWYCEVGDTETVIYANFGDKNPNETLTEINVRQSCFIPEYTGANYITVRGFEMAHAATQWSPPTAEQTGMISTNWSKGWIIENNILHDARCSAVCIGKERSTGHNLYNKYRRKPGYQYQLEAVFAARHIGWSRERIGSHIIRNNTIYDCGQNGIVGHLGGIFSEIYGNHIYNIGNRYEFSGFEIAGIKLHAAIDVYVHNNNIHDCKMGSWFDWQAQGLRLSSNLYYNNGMDLFIETSHGPHMVDNNIFASAHNFRNTAQGGAYVHNLFCGGICLFDDLSRATPYHLSHSTEIMGATMVYGGDDRFYNNVFIGSGNDDEWNAGTDVYSGYPATLDEYIAKISEKGKGDQGEYINEHQPAYINNNCYFNGAKSYDREKRCFKSVGRAAVNVIEENGCVYLETDIPEQCFKVPLVKSYDFPLPRITESPYENADDTEIIIDRDYFGNARSEETAPGAFSDMKNGKILIWKGDKNE